MQSFQQCLKRLGLSLAFVASLSTEASAQLGPIMPNPMPPPPMERWGVFACVSVSGQICGQATGWSDIYARYACGNIPIAYCYRTY